MFLARVKGRVVSTAKDASLRGAKLLVVEPLRIDYDDPSLAAGAAVRDVSKSVLQVTGRAIIAVDQLGAGEGQLVLIAQGSSARMADGCNDMPVDAAVVGIVDDAMVNGHNITDTDSQESDR